MTIRNLKNKIIQQIKETDDEGLLMDVLSFIQTHPAQSDTVFELTEGMKEAIEEGLEDIKHGRVFSNEEASQLIEEWFAKKASVNNSK